MNWEALSAVADVIGVVLVVISLVYLAVQVRQSNQMALAESERELLENWANAVAGISVDDRTADIFLRGLDDRPVRQWAVNDERGGTPSTREIP